METKSMNIPITLGHIEAQTTKHVRRHGPEPSGRHYCDCGNEAYGRGPGGWECDDCKRKNGIATELLAEGTDLNRGGKREHSRM